MERLIAIIGPTAVGKTNIGINLALKLNTEIISGDSMLVFRRMNIGTAKPTVTERKEIPHNLIDILEPTAEFNVVKFQTLATSCISKINSKGNIPILVGGTGLYIKALLEGYKFNAITENLNLRQKLTNLAKKKGKKYIYKMLVDIQPEIAIKIHYNNLYRVIRALEIVNINKKFIPQMKEVYGNKTIYNSLVIGLTMDRNMLYKRINLRVDKMIAQGLVNEVIQLLHSGVSKDCQSMRGIGYKEIIEYLSGQCTITTAIENIKRATRNFAKRQLTWYRNMPYIYWLDVSMYDHSDNILSYIYNNIVKNYYKL